jgi:hypothetical protein
MRFFFARPRFQLRRSENENDDEDDDENDSGNEGERGAFRSSAYGRCAVLKSVSLAITAPIKESFPRPNPLTPGDEPLALASRSGRGRNSRTYSASWMH